MWALLAIAAATTETAPSTLVGEYKGWMVDHGQVSEQPEKFIKWRLSLSADGTFRWQMTDHLMVNIEETATGSYSVKNGHVHLKGKASGISDYGYKREPVSPKFEEDLTVWNQELVSVTTVDMEVIFVKIGISPKIPAGMDPIPILRDRKAVRLLNQTEAIYRGLKSYSDRGEVLKNQENYAPQTSRFSTYFVAPGSIRFSAQIVEGGKPVAKAELWTKNHKIRYFNSLDDYTGVQTDGAAGMDIFDMGQQYGTDAVPAPSLLLGDRFPLGGTRQIELQGIETVGGTKCWIVQVNYDRATSTIYWIDRATYMIVKIRSRNVADIEEITLWPQVNPKISAKQLAPTEP